MIHFSLPNTHREPTSSYAKTLFIITRIQCVIYLKLKDLAMKLLLFFPSIMIKKTM